MKKIIPIIIFFAFLLSPFLNVNSKAEKADYPCFFTLKKVDAISPAPTDRDVLIPFYKMRPPHAKWLKNRKVYLDPGHGGDGHRTGYKVGPTGLREAKINIEVAKLLKKLLLSSGAQILMCRDGDDFLTLKDRVDLANYWGADIFISMHHNAAGRDTANYVSTWYRGDIDNNPASLDLASKLSRRMIEVLSLEEYPAQELYSDLLMYKTGFGVLRNLNMPACLVEASFFTHPAQEKKMRDINYLAWEAWAYYLGICDYFADSAPFIEDNEIIAISGDEKPVKIRINDGVFKRGGWKLNEMRIFANSIRIAINDEKVPFNFDKNTGLITVESQYLPSIGRHLMEIDMQNLHGQHPAKKEIPLIIRKRVKDFRIKPLNEYPQPGEFIPIQFFFYSDKGSKIKNGQKGDSVFIENNSLDEANIFLVQSDNLSLQQKIKPIKNGLAIAWLIGGDDYPMKAVFSCDSVTREIVFEAPVENRPSVVGTMIDDKAFEKAVFSTLDYSAHWELDQKRFFFAPPLNQGFLEIYRKGEIPLLKKIALPERGQMRILLPNYAPLEINRAPEFLPPKVREIYKKAPPLYLYCDPNDEKIAETLEKTAQIMKRANREVFVVYEDKKAGKKEGPLPIYDSSNLKSLEEYRPLMPFAWIIRFKSHKNMDNEKIQVCHEKWNETTTLGAKKLARVVNIRKNIQAIPMVDKTGFCSGLSENSLIVEMDQGAFKILSSQDLSSILLSVF